MKYILILFCCINAFFSFAQEKKVHVVVRLFDEANDDAVRNANVIFAISDTNYSFYSNNRGKVYIYINEGRLDINIKHRKYQEVSLRKKTKALSADDTIYFDIKMNYIKEQNIEEMVVTAPGKPSTVFKSNVLHVSDFEILNSGEIVLLTYPKQLKKGSQLIIYDGQKIKNRFNIPYRSLELVHDYRGNTHVVCENTIMGVNVKDNKLSISELDKGYYMKYVAPIVDTNVSKIYFSTFNKDYPAFDYVAYDQLDSSFSKIVGIEDELMMELYRSEYKWVDVRAQLWARNKEIKTGIDAEIWIGANYFTQSLYYKELYAPMFKRNDTLFVFDYYKDMLRTFTDFGEVLDSIPIYHHYNSQKTGWKKNVIQDRVTGEIYAVYERAGYTYIGWIDTKSGEISEHVRLNHRYIHKISIFKNQVYYIYRPYESTQKKYLYKERLPYEFGNAEVAAGEVFKHESISH